MYSTFTKHIIVLAAELQMNMDMDNDRQREIWKKKCGHSVNINEQSIKTEYAVEHNRQKEPFSL